MSNIGLTIIGISFIFLMTTLGSAMVFFFKKNISDKFNSIFLGFSSGLMIAASIWSLIIPALDQSGDWGNLNFIPAACGMILGCLFLVMIDFIVPKLKKDKQKLSRNSKFFLAVTVHNIPEGLAVGLAFGCAFIAGTSAAFYGALGLAIGIGIQNFPEGAAISLPLQKQTQSKAKSFWLGTLSGTVEPVMALIGIWLSTKLTALMPWFMSFAAGAMLFVVCEELIPESRKGSSGSLSTWSFIIGFILMMILDVALG